MSHDTRPAVSTSRASKWARSLFGIDAEAGDLPGFSERNFRLESGDGSRFVMKISYRDRLELRLEAEMAVLALLESGELAGIVPRVIPARSGGSLARATDENRQHVVIRLYNYLPGRPFALVDKPSPELCRDIGRWLGKLDRTLFDFDHPGFHPSHDWELTRVSAHQSLLELLEPDTRPLVRRGLQRFVDEVHPHLGKLRRTVIHNDANDYNLLVETTAAGFDRLCGIIDFGDMTRTITVAEPAIACAYAMLDSADPHAVAEEITAAYEQELALTALERKLLPVLVVGRLCASILLSTAASADDPGNDYLTVSRRPALHLLRKLL